MTVIDKQRPQKSCTWYHKVLSSTTVGFPSSKFTNQQVAFATLWHSSWEVFTTSTVNFNFLASCLAVLHYLSLVQHLYLWHNYSSMAVADCKPVTGRSALTMWHFQLSPLLLSDKGPSVLTWGSISMNSTTSEDDSRRKEVGRGNAEWPLYANSGDKTQPVKSMFLVTGRMSISGICTDQLSSI